MPSKVFTERPSGAVSSRAEWGRLALGLTSIYALFQWSALSLGSDRGQAGLLVAAIVVTGTLFVEYAWSRRSMSSLLRVLGLGRPRRQGLAMAFAVSVLVLLTAPTYALITGASVTMREDWLSLVPGLFAQAGVAEETLFRGYLFGHIRTGRSFWRAATVSMLPFAAVHLILFVTLPFWVALAALLLAVMTSFPLAQLYELGGRTIWAPALLHFVVQGTAKVVVVSGDAPGAFPLAWMMASAVLPLVVLLLAPAEHVR